MNRKVGYHRITSWAIRQRTIVPETKDFRSCLALALCALLAACAISTPSIKKQGAISSIEKVGLVYRILVPTTEVFLEFPSEGFRIFQADDSTPYYWLQNDIGDINVSFNFELAGSCTSSESCRDLLVKRSKQHFPNAKNWQILRIGDVFVSEFMLEFFGNRRIDQQHMNAHFVKYGVWIDVHLSKIHYQQTDRDLFINLVRSIQFR